MTIANTSWWDLTHSQPRNSPVSAAETNSSCPWYYRSSAGARYLSIVERGGLERGSSQIGDAA